MSNVTNKIKFFTLVCIFVTRVNWTEIDSNVNNTEIYPVYAHNEWINRLGLSDLLENTKKNSERTPIYYTTQSAYDKKNIILNNPANVSSSKLIFLIQNNPEIRRSPQKLGILRNINFNLVKMHTQYASLNNNFDNNELAFLEYKPIDKRTIAATEVSLALNNRWNLIGGYSNVVKEESEDRENGVLDINSWFGGLKYHRNSFSLLAGVQYNENGTIYDDDTNSIISDDKVKYALAGSAHYTLNPFVKLSATGSVATSSIKTIEDKLTYLASGELSLAPSDSLTLSLMLHTSFDNKKRDKDNSELTNLKWQSSLHAKYKLSQNINLLLGMQRKADEFQKLFPSTFKDISDNYQPLFQIVINL